MSKLFVYGCSFTWFGSSHIEEAEKYHLRAHQWVKERSWPKLLADNLGLELIHYGHPGASNDQIYNTITSTFEEISKDDLVIVSWTHPFRVPIKGGHTMMPTMDISVNSEFEDLLKYYTKYLYDENLSLRKLVSLSKGISDCFPCKSFYSISSNATTELLEDKFNYNILNSDLFLVSPSTNNSPLYDITQIRDTERHFSCCHPNEAGHKHIADTFFNILKHPKRNNLI